MAQKKRTTIERVREFHTAFGHPVVEAPLIPDVRRIKLRLRLILEEGGVELIQACGGDDERSAHLRRAIEMIKRAQTQIEMAKNYEFETADLVAIADALTDNDYVNAGAALEFGIPLDACGEEVHKSNMTKLGEDGKPIYDSRGKIKKGPNYQEPDLQMVLNLEASEEASA